MNEGKIKKLMEKGFGFITVPGRPKDLFFHSSKLVGVSFNELQEGDRVVFDSIENDGKGDAAVGVRLAD